MVPAQLPAPPVPQHPPASAPGRAPLIVPVPEAPAPDLRGPSGHPAPVLGAAVPHGATPTSRDNRQQVEAAASGLDPRGAWWAPARWGAAHPAPRSRPSVPLLPGLTSHRGCDPVSATPPGEDNGDPPPPSLRRLLLSQAETEGPLLRSLPFHPARATSPAAGAVPVPPRGRPWAASPGTRLCRKKASGWGAADGAPPCSARASWALGAHHGSRPTLTLLLPRVTGLWDTACPHVPISGPGVPRPQPERRGSSGRGPPPVRLQQDRDEPRGASSRQPCRRGVRWAQSPADQDSSGLQPPIPAPRRPASCLGPCSSRQERPGNDPLAAPCAARLCQPEALAT